MFGWNGLKIKKSQVKEDEKKAKEVEKEDEKNLNKFIITKLNELNKLNNEHELNIPNDTDGIINELIQIINNRDMRNMQKKQDLEDKINDILGNDILGDNHKKTYNKLKEFKSYLENPSSATGNVLLKTAIAIKKIEFILLILCDMYDDIEDCRISHNDERIFKILIGKYSNFLYILKKVLDGKRIFFLRRNEKYQLFRLKQICKKKIKNITAEIDNPTSKTTEEMYEKLDKYQSLLEVLNIQEQHRQTEGGRKTKSKQSKRSNKSAKKYTKKYRQ